MSRILMSQENPEGYKLEELLKILIEEVREKDDTLEEPEPSESSPLKGFVVSQVKENNRHIIECFKSATRAQNNTMAAKLLLGADNGPTGAPRIGGKKNGS